jgi:hypothetical protein
MIQFQDHATQSCQPKLHVPAGRLMGSAVQQCVDTDTKESCSNRTYALSLAVLSRKTSVSQGDEGVYKPAACLVPKGGGWSAESPLALASAGPAAAPPLKASAAAAATAAEAPSAAFGPRAAVAAAVPAVAEGGGITLALAAAFAADPLAAAK